MLKAGTIPRGDVCVKTKNNPPKVVDRVIRKILKKVKLLHFTVIIGKIIDISRSFRLQLKTEIREL